MKFYDFKTAKAMVHKQTKALRAAAKIIKKRRKKCEFCNGNGYFYSDPDFGPCECKREKQ